MMLRIEDLSREELDKKCQLGAELSTAIDGLWFLAVEKAMGFERALEMDIDVWASYATVSVKRIRRYFTLSENGFEALKEVIKYDPIWLSIDFEWQQDTPQQLVFQVNSCPVLEAQERMGRKTLTCMPVETAYLSNLAEAIDPKMWFKPLQVPPRKSPDEICCSWLFSLEETASDLSPG